MRSVFAALAALILVASPVSAAPAEQPCNPGVITQFDMAGVYTSMESLMRLTVYPCGGMHLLWSNPAGTHEAVYATTERLPADGVIARIYQADPFVRSLDGRNVIGVKPAEPGFIQIITMGPFLDDVRVYRLQKMT